MRPIVASAALLGLLLLIAATCAVLTVHSDQMQSLKMWHGKSPTVGVPIKFPGDLPGEGVLVPTPQEFDNDPYTHTAAKVYRDQFRSPTVEGLISHAQQVVGPKAASLPSPPDFKRVPTHFSPFAHGFSPFTVFNVALPAAQVLGGAGGPVAVPHAGVGPMHVMRAPFSPTMSWQGMQIAGAAPQAVGIHHLPRDSPQRFGTGGGEFKTFGTAMNVWTGTKGGKVATAPKGFKSQGAPMELGSNTGAHAVSGR